jgi:predicted DCC family thiol-disulfide oxidoreductase YuxK
MSGGVILFDGTCAFCEGWVRFFAARDRGYFKFGASQTAEAATLLAQYGTTRDAARSIILIEDGQVYLRSTAALRIMQRLVTPWSWLGVLLWVPLPIRDAVYNVIAAVRHRIAGESNACDIPPPEIRSRLITP